MQKILFAIESCHKNIERLHAINATWLNDLNNTYDPIIFVGNNEENGIMPFENSIQLECSDKYLKLTEKTYHILKWYLTNYDSDFIIIADDDIYVNCNKFNKYTTFLDYDYIGRFAFGGFHPVDGVEMSGFASGCFYILSKNAAKYVINNFTSNMIEKYNSAEDACVGHILETNSMIKKYDETSIMPWSRCRYFDNLMVGHYMHLKNDPPLTFMESMKKMHNLYCGDNS